MKKQILIIWCSLLLFLAMTLCISPASAGINIQVSSDTVYFGEAVTFSGVSGEGSTYVVLYVKGANVPKTEIGSAYIKRGQEWSFTWRPEAYDAGTYVMYAYQAGGDFGDEKGGYSTVSFTLRQPTTDDEIPETGTTAEIYVDSLPSGAKVYVDEMYIGVTPILCKGLTAGSHTFLVIKSGYYTASKVETLLLGRNTDIGFSLVLMPTPTPTTVVPSPTQTKATSVPTTTVPTETISVPTTSSPSVVDTISPSSQLSVTPTDTGENDDIIPLFLILAIGGGIAVFLMIIIIIFVMKSKNDVKKSKYYRESPSSTNGSNIHYHVNGTVYAGNVGVLAKDDAVVNRPIVREKEADEHISTYCPYCGKKLPADAKFCMGCGKKLK